MENQSLESLFLRFVRRADTAALAEVFDRVAPELLRVGVHLTGSAAEAEDLVQATFLIAIERREGYDSTRPLVPWLVGILTNRARAEGRTERRREGRALESERLRPRLATGPEDAAEAGELDEALVESMDRLPEAERQVVVLYLRHELPPADIAHALGRSPSTVRTQLQRGLERLRKKLPRGFAASGLFALPSPRGLAAVRAEVLSGAAAAAATTAASTTLFVSLLTMKKAILVGAALAAAAVVGILLRPRSEASDSAGPGEPVQTETARAPEALEPVSFAPVEREAVAVEPEAEPEFREAAPVEDEGPPASESAAPVDKDREEWFDLKVVDPFGTGIPGVEIHAYAIRGEDGGHYLWPGEAPRLTTNAEGLVRIQYPTWVSELAPSRELTVELTHSEFQPQVADLGVALDDGEVQLEFGNFVVVTGWIASPEEVITDVVPHMTFSQASLGAGSWAPLRDGRLATSRMATGGHGIYLSHTGADGGRYFSDVVAFEVEEGEHEELHIQLVPAGRLTGRIDPAVPRPIRNGVVQINLTRGGTGPDGVLQMHRPYTVTVADDGSFAVDRLPPGQGQIIGMCDGWVSRSVPVADMDPAVLPEVVRKREVDLQRIRTDSSEEIVLLMEPTASFELTVLGPDDEPLAGVHVAMWPNVSWDNTVGEIFLEREYGGFTDEEGRCRIDDLPVGWTGYSVSHQGFVAPIRDEWGHRTRSQEVDLVSGETARETLKLEPRPTGE